jgi:hypothetical protein
MTDDAGADVPASFVIEAQRGHPRAAGAPVIRHRFSAKPATFL